MDLDAISRQLRAHGISPANQQILAYWMSLCEEDAPPRRARLDPAQISDFLRSAGLFDVRPGEGVRCRIAGMVLKLVFGPNLAGQDWLAITPARHRAQRLARYSAVAEGAIGLGRRQALRNTGESVRIEEVMLPFADVGEDGSRPVLVHTDWRPEGDEWLGVNPSYALILADEFHLIALR